MQVSGLKGVVEIAAGPQHSLALDGDGSVWAWGRNADGTSLDTVALTPVKMSALSGVAAIAASGGSNLALKSDGTVWEWDSEPWPGQSYQPPAQVSGLTGIVAISGGLCRRMALKADGYAAGARA